MASAVFESRFKNLRICIQPGVDHRTTDGKLTSTIGKHVQFEGGIFTTKDKETIDALKRCSSYGIDFKIVDSDDEVEKEVFYCETCGKDFASKIALRGHARTHRSTGPRKMKANDLELAKPANTTTLPKKEAEKLLEEQMQKIKEQGG